MDAKQRFTLAVVTAVGRLAIVDDKDMPKDGFSVCEAAFFEAVDAGATYVKESGCDPIIVDHAGDNNLTIDEKGLVVIYPDGSCRLTVDNLDDNIFGTLFVGDDEDTQEEWSLRDALDGMKKFLGWTEGCKTVAVPEAVLSILFGVPAVNAQMIPTMAASKSALLGAVMKANNALWEAEGVIVAGYIPSARQLIEVEKAFFAAVDAGAVYVKESGSDPIVVGSKGNNTLVIDEKGLAVIYAGGGSAHITIDHLGNTPFATFYVDDRGVQQTWQLRDALTSMKRFVGWKEPTSASTEVAS